MTTEDDPMQHCQLAEQANLIAALDATAIEHLEVNESRTVVIYQSAILTLTMTDGQLRSAREFDVKFLEPPAHAPDSDPDEFLTGFLDELVAATGTERR